MPIPAPTTKPEWRAWAQETRRQLSRPDLSAALCARLATLPELRAAATIALYAATPEEWDLLPLTALSGKRVLLPRCAPGRRLAFHDRTEDLVMSAFGIREPAAHLPEVPLGLLELVVVPALAATPDGYRLGYGGGYYDRLLARLRPETVTVTVLPDALCVPTLPIDPWDLPVKILVTETRILRRPDSRGINSLAVPL